LRFNRVTKYKRGEIMDLRQWAVGRETGPSAHAILNSYLATTPQMVSDFTAPQESLEETKAPIQPSIAQPE